MMTDQHKKTQQKWFGYGMAAFSLVGATFLSFGWPFFHFITYGGRKKPGSQTPSGASERKKWFKLKHTQINHPKYRDLPEKTSSFFP